VKGDAWRVLSSFGGVRENPLVASGGSLEVLCLRLPLGRTNKTGILLIYGRHQ